MLISLILTILTATFAYLYYIKNTHLKELRKYTEFLENDLLQKQIKLEEATQNNKMGEATALLDTVDYVTGLPGRQIFEDRAIQTINMSKRFGKPAGILFVDIKDFSAWNDKLGTEKANLLLNEVAQRLSVCVRQIDTVTRYKADLFVILLPQLVQPEMAAYAAQRMLAKFKEPFVIEEMALHVEANIGISVFPVDGETLTELLTHAERALDRSKAETEQQYLFNDPNLQAITERENKIVNILRRPDLLNKLIVYCVPQVNASDNRIIGIKAIPYIQDIELGLLTYDDYARLAEKENKLFDILAWLISRAIVQFQKWNVLGLKPERLAIDVSAKQIQNPDFMTTISNILAETHFNPKHLAFEVTAENFTENAASLHESFANLDQLGVQLSIGVFALGHLAIQKITQLPVHYLKIDPRLIQTLSTYAENEMILGALMDLAHNMGLEAIAEGVDEEKQKNLLRKLGFKVMQGKLFGEPQPMQFFLR
ncbi:MAG: EAL domain-containing protein [Gammaproteobacteria bacterium]|nr:EAL domain-containing protein [Gammaproteobacteria bacterium]